MILTLSFIAILLAIICFQQVRLNDLKDGGIYWYKAYKDTLHWYSIAYNRLYSPRQRKLEKAYRAQLKRSYKNSYGLFLPDARQRAAQLQNNTWAVNNVAPQYRPAVYKQQRENLDKLYSARPVLNYLP